MGHDRRLRQGIALMTALLVGTFLLVLGLAFLAFIERDVNFASRQERQARAYYLALSGMRYYERRCGTFYVTPTQRHALPTGDPNHFFEVVYSQSSRTVVSRGFITNSVGNIIAERTLVAPQGNVAEFYEEGQ